MTSSMSFVALDTETANSSRASICSFGATVVTNGIITDERSWLIRPPAGHDEFSGRNSSIHGITAEMVDGAARFDEQWPEIERYIGSRTVVAHNASFDMGVVRSACEVSDHPWPEWTFGCTLVMARRSLDLISYRLPIVAAHLGVPLERHHDALADSRACALVLLTLANRHDSSDLSQLASTLSFRFGRIRPGGWDGCGRIDPGRSSARSVANTSAIPPTASDADPDHPLYGRVITFTGGLGSMTRQGAWAAVADFGATPAKGLTRKTTMLVIGDGFRGDDLSDFQTGKARKAVELRAKGQSIEVLTEDDLLELLNLEPDAPASPSIT